MIIFVFVFLLMIIVVMFTVTVIVDVIDTYLLTKTIHDCTVPSKGYGYGGHYTCHGEITPLSS